MRYIRTILYLSCIAASQNLVANHEHTVALWLFEGKHLELNALIEGSLRVGILREDGAPIEGHKVAQCASLCGDDARMRVRWLGEEDVSSLSGRPIRLRFELTRAKLFAFQFTH